MPACRQGKQPLTRGWRLFYFNTHRWHSKRKVRFNVSEPFWKVYTSPMPKYNPEIVICRNTTYRLCSEPSTNYDLKSLKEDDCPEELDLHQRFSIWKSFTRVHHTRAFIYACLHVSENPIRRSIFNLFLGLVWELTFKLVLVLKCLWWLALLLCVYAKK